MTYGHTGSRAAVEKPLKRAPSGLLFTMTKGGGDLAVCAVTVRYSNSTSGGKRWIELRLRVAST